MDLASLNYNKLRVRHYPDPILRQIARPVTTFDEHLAQFAERMVEIMVLEDGVGLAAPQLGVPLRIFVASLTGKVENAEIFVNPELSNFQGHDEMEEGCLSVPGVRGNVRRAAACTLNACDLDGTAFTVEAIEFAARVVQHEADHLEGTLLIDRLTPVAKIACRRAIKLLEKNG